ncbi:Defective proboscis extension response (Dpr)-related isoform 3 [Schistosoma japonicum]|uniref:Defective proboscis extension response (Dpr)-related isoform 3 n=1 Tax=Schistosoma japonicum TaxID=6182 RepID=A0A4Z2DQF4_SCHJA|nr:Defective proboscis extension response (Dpr)-related isoform 3 [Schistosoma japonicum]
MWIFQSTYRIIYTYTQIQRSILHDTVCIWMAICSANVNLYLITIITFYILIILCEKQLNNNLHQLNNVHLLKYVNSNQHYQHVGNDSQLKLNLIKGMKRSAKFTQDYLTMNNNDTVMTKYKDYTYENDRLQREKLQKQEITHQSNSYFNLYQSNNTYNNLLVNNKPNQRILPNFLSSSQTFHSITSKLSTPSLLSSSHSNVKAVSEPYFDPDQPVYITSIKNSTAIIPCKVKDIDFSSTVMSWWKEDLPMPLTVGSEISLPHYAIDRTEPDSWTLMIFHVTEADSGTYICQINLADIKEKFFYLKVIVRKNEPDMTKLNDEYVKDDIVQNTLWRTSSKQKIQFHHPTPTSSIQWYYNGNRIYPNLENNHLTLKDLYIDIQSKWINQTTMLSRLNIGRLTRNNSGIWTCRKVSDTQLESLEESSLNLQTTNSKTERSNLFNYNAGKSLQIRILTFNIYLYFLYFYIVFSIFYYSYV